MKTNPIYRTILTSAALLSLGASAIAGNLALTATYSYTLAPGFSGGTYYLDNIAGTTLDQLNTPFAAGDLNDGIIYNTGNPVTDVAGSMVAWNPTPKASTITFDLGAVKDVKDVIVTTYARNDFAIYAPTSVTISYSADNVSYGTAINHALANVNGAGANATSSAANGVRYVKLAFDGTAHGGDKWGLTEINIQEAQIGQYPTTIDVASNDSVTIRTVDVDITNVSTATALDITDIQVTGLDAASFTPITAASPGTPFQIAANTNGTIQLSFDPAGFVGDIDAQLEITSNDIDSPQLIPISGLIRDPWIDTDASVTVPTLATNTPATFDVTIDNLGAHDLTIFDALTSGTDAAYFTLVTDLNTPLVIGAGSSATVTFSFDPAGQERAFSANLEFDSDDQVEPTRIVPVTASLAKTTPAALSLRLDGNSFSPSLSVGTGLRPIPGAPHPLEYADNTKVTPSAARNFYYDANGDLAFDPVDGDTAGNTDGTLDPRVTVTGTQVLNFYVDSDANNTIAENFAANAYRLNGLTITLSDGSTVPLDVTQGTPQTFADPGGETWSVALDGVGLLSGATTDIVGNINSVPDSQGPDYHFTLTFTYGSVTDPTFDDWAAGFGIPNAADDDSDLDGIPALMEYGIGYNPTVAETLPGLLPSGADFTITWPKGAEAAVDSEISYVVEVSANLADWDPAAPADLVESGTDLVLTLPGGQGKTFARLTVVRTIP